MGGIKIRTRMIFPDGNKLNKLTFSTPPSSLFIGKPQVYVLRNVGCLFTTVSVQTAYCQYPSPSPADNGCFHNVQERRWGQTKKQVESYSLVQGYLPPLSSVTSIANPGRTHSVLLQIGDKQ